MPNCSTGSGVGALHSYNYLPANPVAPRWPIRLPCSFAETAAREAALPDKKRHATPRPVARFPHPSRPLTPFLPGNTVVLP